MARVAASDLILTFSQGASTNPNSTQIGLIITNFYRQAFRARNATYTTDTDAIIDSEDVWGIIMTEVSDYVNQFAKSLAPNSEMKPPKLVLSKESVDYIKNMTAETLHLIENVRMWNDSEADY